LGSVGVGEFLDWPSDSVLQEGHCLMKLDTYSICVKILRGLDLHRNSGKKGNLMIEENNVNLG
jgi:hypothetical protein